MRAVVTGGLVDGVLVLLEPCVDGTGIGGRYVVAPPVVDPDVVDPSKDTLVDIIRNFGQYSPI